MPSFGEETNLLLPIAAYYTLSHPENDCDVTERAQGYTMRQSLCFFLNV